MDPTDKGDWSVRPEAADEVLPKAVANYPVLEGLTPVATYAGLRPAGRDTNCVIGQSAASERFINVAAIRSTGLSASLGIGAYVADLLESLGVPLAGPAELTAIEHAAADQFRWQRTANRYAS